MSVEVYGERCVARPDFRYTRAQTTSGYRLALFFQNERN